jgi:hypothetical protein
MDAGDSARIVNNRERVGPSWLVSHQQPMPTIGDFPNFITKEQQDAAYLRG